MYNRKPWDYPVIRFFDASIIVPQGESVLKGNKIFVNEGVPLWELVALWEDVSHEGETYLVDREEAVRMVQADNIVKIVNQRDRDSVVRDALIDLTNRKKQQASS